jgi:hypothetical protein
MQTIQFLTLPEPGLRLRWPPAAEDATVFRDLCRANLDYRIELNARGEGLERLAGDPELPGFVLDLRLIWEQGF